MILEHKKSSYKDGNINGRIQRYGKLCSIGTAWKDLHLPKNDESNGSKWYIYKNGEVFIGKDGMIKIRCSYNDT